MMSTEFFCAIVDEEQLNELAAGRQVVNAMEFSVRRFDQKSLQARTGVIWEGNDVKGLVQPLALVARREDQRRLFGRFATLRSDLSPLTTWCNVIRPQHIPLLDGLSRRATLNGFEAAWTGLAVAEALLLSDRSISKLRLAACQATQTFAVARSHALWGHSLQQETLARYDLAQQLFRTNLSGGGRLREYLDPIWAALSAAAEYTSAKTAEVKSIAAALVGLNDVRRLQLTVSEIERFIAPLVDVLPEARVLVTLPGLRPEQRLSYFDDLLRFLEKEEANGPLSVRSRALAMLAGYVATIAAGGAPSLSLAENARRPDVLLWAYTLGSIGEKVTWTSSFDGLGRLVARELARTYRASDQPLCDISLDEAEVLVDPQLSDPFVWLKLKQARVAAVELLPGVNVLLSVADSVAAEPRRQSVDQHSPRRGAHRLDTNEAELMARFADSLWPHLRGLVEDLVARESAKSSRPRAKRRDDELQEQRKLIEP